MNSKKNVSTYVILSIALVGCVVGMVFLGMNLFADKTVKMQNLENMTKEQVFDWATKNKVSDYISYKYEYSDTVDEGVVISQSIEPKTAIEKEFNVTISKGSIIDLNVNDYKTKKEFEDFISQYPKVKVTYTNDTIHIDSSELTKFSKNQIDIKNDELIVYLSSDDIVADPKEEDTKPEKQEEDKTGDKVLIPSNLLGMEEDKFLAKLKELGFTNVKKATEKYYSFTSKKDTIYSYDDGKFAKDKTINYALSLGDYVTAFNAKEYNGLTLTKANELVKKYNALNAHITLNTKNVETKDTKLIDTIANCKCEKNGTKSIITCDLYVKQVEEKNVPSYAGKSETEMQNALKELGFTKFNKTRSQYSTFGSGIVISNDTGNKKTTATINYVLSLGSYIPNLNEYNGKTLNDARIVANNYNSQGANVQIANPQSVDTNDHPNNTLYNCTSNNGSGSIIITCNLAINYSRYNIPSEAIIKQNYSTASYDSTIIKLKELFDGKFVNVVYRGVESSLSVGQVVNVTVNGNDVYEQGEYDSTTSIVIDVCNKVRN